MYENVFVNVQGLEPAARIFPGGCCEILFTPIENVFTWPSINPETGGIDDEIELKPNTVLYTADINPHTNSFEEETQEAVPGHSHAMEINGTLPGNVAANVLTLAKMKYHKFLVIFKSRNGDYRFIGDEDSGAKLSYKYTEGNISKSRNRDIKFIWAAANQAPIYLGTLTEIPITIATGGSFMFLEAFKVKAGQPMEPGDSTYTHAGLENKKIFMLINREKVPTEVNDMEGEQYVTKTLGSSTATVKSNGVAYPVNENDIVEIYAHD